jgi:hypothetical protein
MIMQPFILKYVRLIFGFLIAPLTMGIILAVSEIITDGYLAWWYFQWSVVIGYPAAFIFGIPLYVFFLEAKGLKSFFVYVACGICIGSGAYFLPFITIAINETISGSTSGLGSALGYSLVAGAPYAIIGMIFGAISASVFWVIAIWRRPGG